jgi:hypothetical protein
MAPSVLRRRVATAAGLYLSVGLGILGTIAAARILGLEDFGRFATVVALVGLAQTLLDLTVEESLTKFGFRYIAAKDWGRTCWWWRSSLARAGPPQASRPPWGGSRLAASGGITLTSRRW